MMPQFEIKTSRSGQPSLQAHLENGRSIYINSAYDPAKEAENWISQIDFKNNDLILLYGLGLGYHLRQLLIHLPQGTQVFVLEPSREVIQLARQAGIATKSLSSPDVFLAEDWKEFKKVYQDHGSRWKNLKYLKIPSYLQLYPEEYRSITRRVTRELNSLLVDRCTVLSSARLWQENLLKNLRFLSDTSPVSPAFGAWKNRPAILVSAGPSLRKNAELLHQAKGRALIIATGTVGNLMQEIGIDPDLILSFDGNEGNYQAHFEGTDLKNTVLVFDPAVHYRVVENHQGPKAMMVINEANLWLEKSLGPIGLVKSGPSIANTGFALAYQFGADPIVLIGQDLAYSDGLTHAPGTHRTDRKYQVPREWLEGRKNELPEPEADDIWAPYWLQSEVSWVDGVNGGKVPTDRKMLTFLHWFEEVIENLNQKRTIIDATEGGAIIQGTRLMRFQDVLDNFCRENLENQIQNFCAILGSSFDDKTLDLLPYLYESKRVMSRLLKLCTKGTRWSKAIYDHFESGKDCDVVKLNSRLDAIDSFISKTRGFQAPFHYVIHPILGSAAHSGLDAKSPKKDIARESMLLYSGLKNALSPTLPLLVELIRLIEQKRPGAKKPVIQAI